MKSHVLSCLALAAMSAAWADSPKTTAQDCDTDKSGGLDRAELVQCFLDLDIPIQKAKKQKPAEQMAADAADDLLDFQGKEVSIERTEARLQSRAQAAAKNEPLVIFSKRFAIGRKLTDAADPRKRDTSAPFILSYQDDRNAGKHSWVAVGSMSYLAAAGDFNPNWSWAFLPGIDADVTTSKAVEESKLDMGLPLRFSWINTAKSGALIDDIQLGIEMHYLTDRDWRSDSYQITLPAVFASRRLGRAGFNTWFGGDPMNRLSRFVFYWQPSLQLELARTADPGTSAKLAAIKASGDAVRIAPGVAAKLTLPIADQRVAVSAGYTHRFDLDQGWDRGMETASIQYDLTSSVALTLAWRKGRKPPDFAWTDEVLFGIGLSQSQ